MGTSRSEPSAEEAAAIAAAVVRFRRDTAPRTASAAEPAEPRMSPWRHAALLEGVQRIPGLPSGFGLGAR